MGRDAVSYADAPMNPTQMLQVRRLLQGAAQSTDPAEGRVGFSGSLLTVRAGWG